MPEQGACRSEAQIAGEREVKPATDAVTVYGSNGQLTGICDVLKDPLAPICEFSGAGRRQSAQPIDISSRGEDVSGAREDDGGDIFPSTDRFDLLCQRFENFGVERVLLFGIVYSDYEGRTMSF